jgi:hypothetical protein
VGEWSIDTGKPDRDAAARHVASFLAAFGDLAKPESATADLMWLDPAGHATRVEEAKPVPIAQLPTDANLVAGLILTGELCGQPGGFRFGYSCVVEYDDEDRPTPVDSEVTVTVFADCWDDSANRGRLAEALKDWERRTGQPIGEWSSAVRGGRIDRYGFRV